MTFTYFAPDALKKGGSYKTLTGIVQKVDDYTRTLTLAWCLLFLIGWLIISPIPVAITSFFLKK